MVDKYEVDDDTENK